MIYKVLMDGASIYESDGNVIILEPKLEQEINTAGSFEFVMPKTHMNYDLPSLLGPEIEVYEGNTLIFFGRPTEISFDIDLQKRVYCEGGLAYFNDSVVAPFTFDTIDRVDLFEYFVNEHNSKVSTNRQFEIGNVTMTSKQVFRKVTNYQSTFECIKKYLLDTEGGYIIVRKENGVRYIDWYEDIPVRSSQPVRFALNLISLDQKVNADFYTSIIPIGADDLTIASVNGGRVYLDSDYISDYGRITGVIEFSECNDPNELLLLAYKYLQDQRYGNPTISCTAAELHYINDEYEPFALGQKVQIVSTPHQLDAVLPIVKLTLDLEQADKEIEIGTLDRKTLTELVKDSEGNMVESQVSLHYDPTPTAGSNNVVTSAGIFSALGPLRFTVNSNGTVTVREVSSDEQSV